MEQRYLPSQSHAEGKIEGYACKWGHVANVPGIGPETFEKNSLDFSEGVSLYFQHDKKNLLANSKSGTLKLFHDDVGLKYEATLPKSATRVLESVQRKDVQGVSVGFVCMDEDRQPHKRRIKKAKLFELSLVDKPAHQTTLKLRSKSDRPRWTDLILEYDV